MTRNKNKIWHGRSHRNALGTTPRHITVTVRTPASESRKAASPYTRHREHGAPTSPLRFQMAEEDDHAPCNHAHDDDADDDDDSRTCCGHRSSGSAAVSDANASSSLSSPTEPAPFCSRQNVPSHAMFALTKFASLLQYVAPGALVAFDIDDTLVKKRHFSCSLVTAEGVRQFHAHIQRNLSTLPYAEKQRLVNALHQEVKAFTLAEDETAQVVRALQDRGACVFGLTARASTMALATVTSLAEMGIDLNRAAPASLPQRAVEPSTGAAVVDGVIYCNDVDKGVVFQKMMQLGWITWPNTSNAANSSSSLSSLPSAGSDLAAQGHHAPTDDGRGCPDRTVWFVDDSLPMITGMVNSWVQMAHAQAQLYQSLGQWTQQIPCRGKLALVCCHYTHPTAAAAAAAPAVVATVEDAAAVVEAQIKHFLDTGAIISDAEAAAKLNGTVCSGEPEVKRQSVFAF